LPALTCIAAVAEHKRAMISQRTKAALAVAKARGTKLGGDRGSYPARLIMRSRVVLAKACHSACVARTT
jgi:DNA invertase Pin-like site-specific DNA recombinase